MVSRKDYRSAIGHLQMCTWLGDHPRTLIDDKAAAGRDRPNIERLCLVILGKKMRKRNRREGMVPGGKVQEKKKRWEDLN